MPERNAAGPGSGLAGKRPAKDALGRRSKTMEAEASSSEDVRGGKGEGSRERGKDAGERRRAEGRGVGDSVEGSKGPWKMVKNHGGAKRTLEKRGKKPRVERCLFYPDRARAAATRWTWASARQTNRPPPDTKTRGHRARMAQRKFARTECGEDAVAIHPSEPQKGS